MCGIFGVYDPSKGSLSAEEVLDSSLESMRHRGPDDRGFWRAKESPLYFGHNRLSILDLSPLGHQPITGPRGKITLTYNGEIYNYRSFLPGLEEQGLTPEGTGDTRVLLNSLEAFGLEQTVKQTNGMFAFAAWDQDSRTLMLARDRIGIKPLYYGWNNGRFFFSSELKPIIHYCGTLPELNTGSLGQYMRNNYLNAPLCIFNGFYKLQPGCFLRIPEASLTREPDGFSPEAGWSASGPKRYWEVPQEIDNSSRSDEEVESEFLELFRSSLSLRTIADVPLGAFLSGGIDSSLVVAYLQELSTGPVKTFTIGFSEAEYDEAPYAKAIAQHLGTDHTELYCSSQDALGVIPDIWKHYDEPFADSSQIPTYLVSKLAAEHVTVSLSGDGGDELFLGYNRYSQAEKLWQLLGRMPAPLRKTFGYLLHKSPPRFWDAVWGVARKTPIGKMDKSRDIGFKVYKLGKCLREGSLAEFYAQVNTHWGRDWFPVTGEPTHTILNRPEDWAFSGQAQLAYIDLFSYLPDDILVKVDRASMACSLEARVPLLDHRIVEFSQRLPQKFKVRNGDRKWLLKKLLAEKVPREMFERPKTGFGIPLTEWLRGPLQEWAGDLLSHDAIKANPYLVEAPIRKLWDQHRKGLADWNFLLWDVLMFQSWYQGNR